MPIGAPKRNKNHYKHGLSHTRIDNIYKGMISRCYNPNNNRYKNYGDDGITVCDEWLNDKKAFFDWAFANGYSDSLTIDRINPHGKYEPSNCRWVDYLIQANNKKTTRKIVAFNEIHTISEWANIAGINYRTLWARLNKGWSAENAIAIPLRKKKASYDYSS